MWIEIHTRKREFCIELPQQWCSWSKLRWIKFKHPHGWWIWYRIKWTSGWKAALWKLGLTYHGPNEKYKH